ncbi:MAG: hypothetical protein K8F91_10885 [Candidatus Obscuribacterales bacterium]|nr:hypothetical protein [Candidatus Obscuribacterales bacterium]
MTTGWVGFYLSPVDSHCYSGYSIPPFYDSLIAKLVAWGENRDEAIERMQRALDEYAITGIKTTIPFHQKVLAHEVFRQGLVSTDFVEKHMTAIKAAVESKV